MDPDSFHRLVKVLADSGEAKTVAQAVQAFGRYGVRIVLDRDVARDIGRQVMALTAINAASRSFMGNVVIDAPADIELTAPGFVGWKLSEFSAWAGVAPTSNDLSAEWPDIHVGGEERYALGRSVRVWANGWNFGLGEGPSNGDFFAPACVAAGGLGVSEAFSILRRDNPYAARRSLGLSLWKPGSPELGSGPLVAELPFRSSWLVGLGHLGQAYAWTLGFMKASQTQLYLQDVDTVTHSTLSTSMLSTASDIGRKKTRVVSAWLEARGYETSVVERRFDQFQKVGIGEPRTALFGVDNAAARRVVEGAGFDAVIDAGLGSGFQDFRAIRVRRFPGPSSAAQLWAADVSTHQSEGAPAYQAMLAAGADACGVATLATRAVGAPFVGCVAAGFTVAEMLRSALGGQRLAVVDVNLRTPESLLAVAA